jgi:hypothetical protein
MANTHGGLIAYGVAERGDCRADRIVSLGAIAEDVYQNIRRVASNLIYPPVVGLHFHYLASADNSESVLALSIPEALIHLIWSDRRINRRAKVGGSLRRTGTAGHRMDAGAND